MQKPEYDPKWLKLFDPLCRQIAKHIFTRQGFHVIDGPFKGVDLMVYHGQKLMFVLEVEYVDPRTPRFLHMNYYSPIEHGVSVPGRKAKFFRNSHGFWMNFSSDLSHFKIIPGHIILAHPLRFYTPYNNTEDEGFYLIPFTHENANNTGTVALDIRERALNECNIALPLMEDRHVLHQHGSCNSYSIQSRGSWGKRIIH